LESIISKFSNLVVLTEATVTRVLFEQASSSGETKAIGVEFYLPSHDKYAEVRNVRREVILSTGS
jgi:hypothetical protein